MKKTIMLSLLMFLSASMGLASCNPKSKTVEPKPPVELGQLSELTADYAVSMDNEYMYLTYGGDYSWFETHVQLVNYLDGETSDGAVAQIRNVYQATTQMDDGTDTQVIFLTHSPDGTFTDVIHNFWIEDFPLNGQPIAITFKQAFDRVQLANIPKPHTRQCILRKQVGPVPANPQYIFGNSRAQLYVDAVTGAVTDKNPVFGGFDLTKPMI